MLHRFEGDAGRRLRVDVLLRQKIVAGNLELAELLADRVELRALRAGDKIIEQGAAGNDVFLILTGSLNIVVNGRIVGRRLPSDHVGEMAAIEPTQRRAASVLLACSPLRTR